MNKNKMIAVMFLTVACGDTELVSNRQIYDLNNPPVICYDNELNAADVHTWDTAVSDWLVKARAQLFVVAYNRDDIVAYDRDCAIVVRPKHVPHDTCTAQVVLGHVLNVVSDGYCFISDRESNDALRAINEGVMTSDEWDMAAYDPNASR